MRRIAVLGALPLACAAAALPALASPGGTQLALVAYSTPKEAYKKIIPAFQATPAGQGISFSQSYGASGDQTRAIINGLPADVVELSLAADMNDLVKAGIVSKGWNRGKYKGMVTDSIVSFVVRDGNPNKIHSWNDLIKPGVSVITPNPFTSGGARWNVMAAYGAQLKSGKTPAQARGYLLKLFQHVAVQDKSARDALNTFLAGKGDVLITYENEAILARHQGQGLYYIDPAKTILVENPVAITNGKNQSAARAFLRFLYTPKAQTLFAQTGYRPVVQSVAEKFKYPARPGLFDIDYLGGWTKVQKRFFDPDTGVMAKIEKQVGGVTG
ncbi:MAG: sulfate ABC transporter substrate-binding protein [Candidatus Rokuibacteriota bacterium]|nr:MAG: sulfate ABC transporter substrate-binding protein [Candidatus Rokubacteria bacterium]